MENVMGGACSTHENELKYCIERLDEEPGGNKTTWKTQAFSRQDSFKININQEEGTWSGFIWLEIGTSGESV
jgi:hypothetical protein